MNIKMLVAIFFVVLVAGFIANLMTTQVVLDANGNPNGTVKRGIGFGSKFPTAKK